MIIKCPECGHQVSDKAPICPSCGVEIAGHIIKCSNCGEIYFKEEGACPNCHHVENSKPFNESEPSAEQKAEGAAPVDFVDAVDDKTADAEPIDEAGEAVEPLEPAVESAEATADNDIPEHEPMIDPIADADEDIADDDAAEDEDNGYANDDDSNDSEQVTKAVPLTNADDDDVVKAEPYNGGGSDDGGDKPSKTDDGNKKNNHAALIVSLLIALVISAVLLFLYNNAVTNNEPQEYAKAMMSHDPTVMQAYLNEYEGDNKSHTDSVRLMLKKLQTAVQSLTWEKAQKLNTRQAYEQFLNENPDTKYKHEIEQRIDELDWQAARKANTKEAYIGYLANHGNGIHKDEAGELAKNSKGKDEASDADAQTAVSSVRRLLQAMNSNNASKVKEIVTSTLSSFRGATNASADAVVKYMKDKRQADVKNLNWHIEGEAEVTKAGDKLHVQLPATLVTEREGGTGRQKVMLSAIVEKDGRVSALDMADRE